MRSAFSDEGLQWSAEELDAARESLIRAAPILSPGYKPFWHHLLIADGLEKVSRGDIAKLMILVPPQHGKTLLASNIFPAWTLGQQDDTIFAAAYAANKAQKEAKALQRVMESDGYRALFPTAAIPSRSDPRRGWIRNADEFNLIGHSGRREYRCFGVGGQGTGSPRSLGLIDDPVKNMEEARSEAYRERNWEWYAGVYDSRRNVLRSGVGKVRDVLIMTPWDEDDLHGRLLEREGTVEDGGEWHVIRLPAIMEAGMERHPDDLRAVGEALWPEQNSLEELEKRRKLLPSTFEALYQCRPRNPDGGIFKTSWFKRFDPADIPQGIWTISIDANFGTEGAKKDTHSFVSIQVWVLAMHSSSAYFVHEELGRYTALETLQKIQQVLTRFPRVTQTLVENKANGPMILSLFGSRCPGFIGVEPDGSKMARAGAMAPYCEAGNVYVADGYIGDAFLDRVSRFPAKGTDDSVDAMTQCLARLGKNPLDILGFFASLRAG